MISSVEVLISPGEIGGAYGGGGGGGYGGGGGGPPSSGMAVHDPTDPYGDGFTRISAPFHPNDLELWLDKWVVAKRTRDFPMADRLRDEMRKGGVDPAEHRPKV